MIEARINGELVHLPDGTHLHALVTARTDRVAGIAVAVNEAIVPRSEWPATPVRHGDRVEILVAAQGG